MVRFNIAKLYLFNFKAFLKTDIFIKILSSLTNNLIFKKGYNQEKSIYEL